MEYKITKLQNDKGLDIDIVNIINSNNYSFSFYTYGGYMSEVCIPISSNVLYIYTTHERQNTHRNFSKPTTNKKGGCRSFSSPFVNRRRIKNALCRSQQEQRLRECSDAKSLQTVLLKEKRKKNKNYTFRVSL